MTISLNGSTGIVTPEVEGRVIDENGFQVFGGDPENRIINGAFDFWQRGTSSTALGYVAADRWVNERIGGTVTMSRQSHTVGGKFGVNSPQFYLRQSVSGQSAVGDLAKVVQVIENVSSYQGNTITVLGWARRSSGSGNMTIEGEQYFGSGGSPSAGVFSISPTTITLTTSWTPFAAVITVPSITGKTLGTNGNDSLCINFWTSAGSDFNARTNSLGLQTIGVDLWGIHIKRGTHTAAATDFYKAPELGPELARCQRYYSLVQVATFGYNPSAFVITTGETIVFPTEMRAVPSLAHVSAISSTGITARTLQEATVRGARVLFTTVAGGASIGDNSIYSADAEL
jgi:hypothetical protein